MAGALESGARLRPSSSWKLSLESWERRTRDSFLNTAWLLEGQTTISLGEIQHAQKGKYKKYNRTIPTKSFSRALK